MKLGIAANGCEVRRELANLEAVSGVARERMRAEMHAVAECSPRARDERHRVRRPLAASGCEQKYELRAKIRVGPEGFEPP